MARSSCARRLVCVRAEIFACCRVRLILKNLSEQVEIREIDGSHVQILKEPHVRTWAERLAQELRRLGSRTVHCGVVFVASFSDWGEWVRSSIF